VAVSVPEAGDPPNALPAPRGEHLTLRFLGEISDTMARDVTRELGPALVHMAAFDFVLQGLGAFPTTDRPRVVWRGVTRGSLELHALARAVNLVVEAHGGIPDPAPFVPHVTLFRVRSPRDRARAVQLLHEPSEGPPAQVVRATSVELVESRLTPSGPLHTTRASFPLARSPD
jgi:2'-5' RNA ligase